MKPAAFSYVRPTRIDEVIAVLTEQPDSKVLAGGQSLVPMMNMRLATPRTLVDLSHVEGLSALEPSGEAVVIGTMVRQAEVMTHPAVRRRWPLVAEALTHVGHPATRSRGTFGGSLAHGDPAAELPAVLLALDGRVTLAGRSGRREVGADQFFKGYYTTALAEDELLLNATIPHRQGLHWGFREIVRRYGDYALAGAAVALVVDESQAIQEARVALFAIADTPIRAFDAEAELIGTHLGDTEVAREIARDGLIGVEVSDDSLVDADYRRDAISAVVERALLDAATNQIGE